MNPTGDHRPPPQPHRPSFSCDLHPAEKFNGFCPSCLCDRLSTLHPDTSSSLFRRTKSFSASNRNSVNFSAFEPQRRSCDVRVRVPVEAAETLAHNAGGEARVNKALDEKIAPTQEQSRVRVLTSSGRAQTVAHNVGGEIRAFEEQIAPIEEQSTVGISINEGRAQTRGHGVGDEIRAFEEPISPIEDKPGDAGRAQTLAHNISDEIRCFEDPIEAESRVGVPNVTDRRKTLAHNLGDEIGEVEIAVEEEMKKMRDYIDLDFRPKKKKPSVGFWSAASVFSKKWNKWMRKQKAKKQSSSMERTVLPLKKPIPRQYRETQSEVADYGFGRRSCDTDPRFSIDIGRLSVDGPRPSFDPPRASWDEHMMRRSNYSDHRVPVVESIPGDSVQTHQYYLDTSSRRRRSFDRSGKKGSLVNGAEIDEMMMGLNAKVTPETFDFHQRKSNSNSLRDECSEIFELGIRDDGSVIGNVEEKGSKRSGRWGKRWNFWGLINGRSKHDGDDRYSRRNGFDRSSSARGNNGEIRGGTIGNMYRRTSSVSLGNSNNTGGLSGTVRNQSVGENGYGRKKRDDLYLERNRSVDNGLLRFYLTPPRSNNRIAGSRKSSKADNSRSIPRGVYRY